MPNLTIGAVQAEFTADNRKFDVATAGVEKQLEAVGRQAESAAVKVKSAGDVIDRTAAMQERASERARRAWQQELLAQDRAIEKERELARARELSALKAEIEARSTEGLSRKLSEAAEKGGEFLKRGLEFAGIGLGVEIVVDKFKELVMSTMETGVELGHLSQQTGITVENLSVLKYAATSMGIEFETLTKGFKKLSTEVYASGNGGKQAQKAFADLGISETDLKSKGDDLYAVLAIVADRFKDMPDGIKKNALATELFGRAGQQLIPVLNQGAEAIQRLKAQAPIFTDADVESMEKLHKSTVNLDTAWKHVGLSITTAIGPGLTSYLNNFAAGLDVIGEKAKNAWEWLSRIRFGVPGGAAPGSNWMQRFSGSSFYLAPDQSTATGATEGAGKEKKGTGVGDQAAAAAAAAAAQAAGPSIPSVWDFQSKWSPITDAMKAYFAQQQADQAAAAAADEERVRLAGQREWAAFQQANGPNLSAFQTQNPLVIGGPADPWKDLHDSLEKTAEDFTNLHQQVISLIDEGVKSLNETLVQLATGKNANWSGFFRGLAGHAVGSGLQELEGSIFKGLMPAADNAQGVPPAQKTGMSTFLRTVGGLLGLLKPGVGGGAASIPPALSTITSDYQIPYESMSLLDLPGRAIGGPVLAGHAYMVGEEGPEPFIPSTSGRIVSHSAMGGGAFYSIDARGASAAEVEQRVSRAIARAHGSAVQNAILVQQERRRRVPNRNN